MKLKEFLELHEAALQGILAGAFKPVGTFSEKFGSKAERMAKLLGADVNDEAYMLEPKSATEKAAAANALKQPSAEQNGTVFLVRLAGGRKVVHDGTNIVTSKEQFDSLVR